MHPVFPLFCPIMGVIHSGWRDGCGFINALPSVDSCDVNIAPGVATPLLPHTCAAALAFTVAAGLRLPFSRY